MIDKVYHCSKTSGLKYLEPRPSTHKKPWVYATRDITTSAMFLGENFDFICQTGVANGVPEIFERFSGAFDLAYKGKSGSIYVLSGKNFKEDQTSFKEEVVSEEKETILDEIPVNDAKEFLLQLESEGKINIFRYPNMPEYAPTDKSDIVERGVEWTIDFGERTLNSVEKYHPDVLDRVLAQLREKGYEFKSEEWRKRIL